ncbi:DsrE/DsrF/TusD sulfur relay family protein [Acinetobacter sp. CAAS 2-6]|uniref:DsrE/DsrF/TusD sulfur relay family protein n=1 Tax=Acinetobacter sp. CAAS 2-6 TaxID=3016358 RepID=UPI002DD6595E|nr:DsrE family protein [Acinetobacter sp. CAAS 2-6]
MKYLFIFNGAAYGDERTYNGLRLTGALSKNENNQVRLFLMGDAATAAKKAQKVPAGFYNLEVMLSRTSHGHKGILGVCGTCMDARGIQDVELIQDAHRSTLNELAEWTAWTDKVLVF